MTERSLLNGPRPAGVVAIALALFTLAAAAWMLWRARSDPALQFAVGVVALVAALFLVVLPALGVDGVMD